MMKLTWASQSAASKTESMKQLFALLFCVFATAPVALVAQLPEYVPTDNLIGWYPLDAGDPSDYSGNGNDGVAENVTLESDRFGNLNGAVWDFKVKTAVVRLMKPCSTSWWMGLSST